MFASGEFRQFESTDQYSDFLWQRFEQCSSIRDRLEGNLRGDLARMAENGSVTARYLYAMWPPASYLGSAELDVMQDWLEYQDRALEFTWQNLFEHEPLGLLAMGQSFASARPLVRSQHRGEPPGTKRGWHVRATNPVSHSAILELPCPLPSELFEKGGFAACTDGLANLWLTDEKIAGGAMYRWMVLMTAAGVLCGVPAARAADQVVAMGGQFGSFVTLGDDLDKVNSLSPDRVEPQPADEHRVASAWHYFSSRGIRVRVCDDSHTVGAINATVTPATSAFVTEAGVRVGDPLAKVRAAYGERLEAPEGAGGRVQFVRDPEGRNQITFGFNSQGAMTWIALGALRANGWTCGRSKTD